METITKEETTKISEIKFPTLRFHEFTPKLQRVRLDKVASFSKGKGISKNEISESGRNECIRYGELYTHYGETISTIISRTDFPKEESVLSIENDVIIPSSGETRLDIAKASCILKAGVILGGDLNIIRSSHNGVFLSYYLNSKKKIDIAKLSQGNSVVHLYSKQLAALNLCLPSLREQQKIASFLSSIDLKLTQLKRKKELLVQYKGGMMQRIFKQEFRFKDEKGNVYPAWEEKMLGDFTEIKTGSSNRVDSNLESKYIFFDRSQDIRRSDIFLFDCEAIIVPGEGQEFIPKHFEGKFDLHQRTYAIMQFQKCFGRFLFYYLYMFRHHFYSQAVGSTVKSLRLPIFQKMTIQLPNLEEQTKIATFLSAIDDKIDLVSTEIEKTTLFKKGLLQQLFV